MSTKFKKRDAQRDRQMMYHLMAAKLNHFRPTVYQLSHSTQHAPERVKAILNRLCRAGVAYKSFGIDTYMLTDIGERIVKWRLEHGYEN